MSFYRYVWDKRFFLLFTILVLMFESLLMYVSGTRESSATLSNIAYANAGVLFTAIVYLVAGYFYRRPFYRELEAVIRHLTHPPAAGAGTAATVIPALPEPQTAGQAVYLELLNQLQRDHAAKLGQLMQEKRSHQDFIMSWIHEVKLPIAASRLVLLHSGGKSVDYIVDKLEDELDKIDHYVEQALYYSRIDSFSRDYLITEIELGSIVKESVKKAAKLFITKRIRFRMEEDPKRVYSDAKWLGYILDQLLSNGVKYTEAGGELSTRFEEDARERRLIVQDTGIGIAPQDLHRVFDKGFTGSNGRTHAKSTGMGLYLAKQMALKLGHDLSIESQEGVYTRVTVHFPKIRTLYTRADS